MNGFIDTFQKWQTEMESLWNIKQKKESTLRELNQPLPWWQRVLGKTGPWWIPYLAGKTESPDPFVVLQEPQIELARTEHIKAVEDYQRASWFGVTFSLTADALQKSGVRSFDDWVRQHPPEPGTSNADLAEARNYVNFLLGQGTAPEAPPGAGVDLAEWFITTPLETKPRFEGVHVTTVEEMVKWLRKTVPPPELPPGLGEAGLIEYLREAGRTPEEEAEAAKYADEFLAQIEQWEQGREQIRAYKAGEEIEMPAETFGHKLKMAALQPALGIFDMMQPYWKYWEYPLAFQATKAMTGAGNWVSLLGKLPQPGIDEKGNLIEMAWAAAHDQLSGLYDANRDAGISPWMASSKAWEDWEVSEWGKMGIEIVVDPLNIVGFGLFMKLAKGTKAIPIIGKMTGLLGATEAGFIKVADAPIRGAKALIGKIPKTTAQRAIWEVNRSKNAIVAGQEMRWGKEFEFIPDEDCARHALESIDYGLANPGALDPQSGICWAYVQREVFTQSSLLDWGKKVGSAITADDILPGVLESTETAIGNAKILGSHNPVTGSEETAQMILRQILGVNDTPENMRIITDLMTELYTDTITRGRSMAGLPKLRSLKAVGGLSEDIVYSEAYRNAELFRMRHGMWAAIQKDIAIPVANAWRDYVDRQLIMPFARAYLITGSYLPFNWVEEVFRTWFGRGGGVYGRNTPLRFKRKAIGIVYDRRVVEGAWMAELPLRDVLKAPARAGRPAGIGEMSGTALLEQAEQEFSKPVLEKALLLGWLPKKYRSIHEAMYYPIRGSQMAGGMQRSGYLLTRWMDELKVLAPREMAGITKAISDAGTVTITGWSPKTYRAFKQAIEDAVIVGPSEVEKVAKEFTRRNIKMAEVNEAMLRYAGLGDYRESYLVAARSGELWEDTWKYGEKVKAAMADEFVHGPEFKSIRLEELVDELLAGAPVRDRESLMGMVQVLRDITDDSPEAISHVFTGFEERAMRLPAGAPREQAWAEAYDLIYPFIDKVETQSRRVSVYIEANIGDLLNPAQKVELKKYMDMTSARVVELLNTRRLAMRKSEMLIAKKVRPNSFEWQKELNKIWNKHWGTDSKMVAQQWKLSQMLDQAITPQNVPEVAIDAAGRGLTAADVSRLFYAPGDKLSYAMMHSAALQRKVYFVDQVKVRADVMAARAGTTREALGFTDEAIDGVYDSLIYNLRLDPKYHNALSEKFAEIDNLTRDLESIRINNSMDAEAATMLEAHGKRVADGLRELDIYKRPVVEAVPEVAPRAAVGGRGILHDKNVAVVRATKPGEQVRLTSLTDEGSRLAKEQAGRYPSGTVIEDSAGGHWRIEKVTQKDGTESAMLVQIDEAGRETGTVAKLRSYDKWSKEGVYTIADSKVVSVPEVKAVPERIMVEITTEDKAFIKTTKDAIDRNRHGRGYDVYVQRRLDELEARGLDIKEPTDAFMEYHRMSIGDLTTAQFKVAKDRAWDTFLESVESIQKVAVPPVKPPVRALPGEGTEEWWNLKQGAMDKAMKTYYLDFTDYTNGNIMDAAMRSIFPYWIYESQRWLWLPRNFATHPGIANLWGKYMDNSDYGYVHVPGTNLGINLTRGTVYKGGLSTLVRRDYPEYYDQYFPEFFEAMDYAQRWGFFPNIFWNTLATETGGRKPQRGQLLPAVVSTPLQLYVAAHPNSDVAHKLQDLFFPDRFREYQMICEVAYLATDNQIQRGINGVTIWERIEGNVPLTDEEQELWDRARRRVAVRGPLLSHGGIFRLRHEDRIKAYEWWGEFIEEKTGIPPKTQQWLRRHGYSVGDVCEGLSQLNIQQIQEAEEYMRWISPRVTATLRPSNEIEVNLIQAEFWGRVRDHREMNMERVRVLEGRAFSGVGGWMDRGAWIDAMQGIMKDNADYIHEEHGDRYNATTGRWESDPESRNKYAAIPLTIEERAAFYAERGVNLSMSTFDEMLALYYEISPREKIDPVTGVVYMDWGTYFATIDLLTKLMPEELKTDWDTFLAYNDTPGWAIYKDAVKNYLVPYWNTSDVIKAQFSTEEQSLIDEYYQLRHIDPGRAQEIRDYVRPDGTKLISQYSSKVSDSRKKLRMVIPMIDAHLLYWGKTQSLLTPEAETLYNQLVEQGQMLY